MQKKHYRHSQETINLVLNMLKAGKSYRQCADAIGKSRNTIACIKYRFMPREEPVYRPPTVPYVPGLTSNRRYTLAEYPTI